MGDMISPTSELTMAPKAAPMITPMARSTAFPRSANFLNSSIMGRSRVLIQAAPAVRHSRARHRSGLPQIGGLNCPRRLKSAKADLVARARNPYPLAVVMGPGFAPDRQRDGYAPAKLGLREVSPSRSSA